MELKQEEESDPACSGSDNAVLSWSDPVTYLNPCDSAVRETFTAEATVETQGCDVLASLSSVTWSEPSLNVISLTEKEKFGDNSPVQNISFLGEAEDDSCLPLSRLCHKEARCTC